MGTSQVPLVLKSAYKYGQGNVSLQIRRIGLTQKTRVNPWIDSDLQIRRMIKDPRETVPWPYLWADFQTKGTCEVPMT